MLQCRIASSRSNAFRIFATGIHRDCCRNMSSMRLFATSATAAETEDLVKWIESGGGRCESLHIATDDQNGQTLVASRGLMKGKQLVLLPQSRQLKAYSADPGLQRLIDLVPADLWAARLALPVVAERCKGDKSMFWPYLRSLPQGVSGLPVFFAPEEVAALQYPPLVQQINMRCRWLLSFSKEQLSGSQQAQLFSDSPIDANILGWGMGVASSRAFKLGQARQPTMLPLIDLCNHSLEPNCRLETSADGTVRLIADTDIPAAEPIMLNYGPLSNTTLLQDYGFILENNPHDAVEMQVSTDHIQVAQVLAGAALPGEPAAWQKSMLEAIGLGTAGLNLRLARSDPMFDWRLVAATRILSASNKLELQGVDPQQLGSLDAAIPVALENKALRTLAAMCAQLISAMGTRLEDDRRLLQATAHLSSNTKLAVKYRMQLKLFIQAAMALVLNKLKRLQTQ